MNWGSEAPLWAKVHKGSRSYLGTFYGFHISQEGEDIPVEVRRCFVKALGKWPRKTGSGKTFMGPSMAPRLFQLGMNLAGVLPWKMQMPV